MNASKLQIKYLHIAICIQYALVAKEYDTS